MDDAFKKEVDRLRKAKPTKEELQCGLANSEFGKRVYQVHLAALNQLLEEERRDAAELASGRHIETIAATNRGARWGMAAAVFAGLSFAFVVVGTPQVQQWLSPTPTQPLKPSPVAPIFQGDPSTDTQSISATPSREEPTQSPAIREPETTAEDPQPVPPKPE